MNLQLIKKFSEGRPGGLKKIAVDIGMTEQNLHRCINKNKIQAGDLEKIAQLLNVSIAVFFDEQPGANAIASGNKSVAAINSSVDVSHNNDTERIVLLEKLLEEKERTIQLLLKQVQANYPQ